MTQKTTIHGIVIPAAWNEKGEVTSVMIAAYNEEKYLVENTAAGRQLFSLLRERVVATGALRSGETMNVIDIESYQVET